MIRSLYLQILFWWNYRPLQLIIIIAAILRILSAIFSKGYGMHDDHFLVIEVAQKWVEGIPQWFDLGKPSLHSLIYPGLHYLLFSFFEAIGITDPQTKMYFVRMIHALYSLLIVYFGYKIALQISDKKTASIVGIILATLWCLPFLSVRNLREITCIPPLLMGFYYLYKSRISRNYKRYLIISGALFAVAFTFRYQTLFFPAGLGLVLFFQKDWKSLLYSSFSFFVFVFTLQGVLDWFAWGYPFASLHAYYLYNSQHANAFITAPWYQHILTLVAYLGPPASLIFVWGFLKSWRKVGEIFWPVLIFLFFHSLFPNKQERFIFPLIPFIVLLGVIGWQEFVKRSVYWRRHPKFLNAVWTYFWIVNTIALLFYSFTYSKRSRVEAMYYLHNQNDFEYALLESYRDRVPFPPLFYLDKWYNTYELSSKSSLRRLKRDIKYIGKTPPNYIVLFGDKDLEKRIQRIKTLFPDITQKTVIDGSFIDELLLKLNPKFQANDRAYIYKIN